ncbi:DUF4309 domain-containing protein [Laceyella putida]|uniref:DUF4309 domain-containing protein n=1 Tax=Laceyella putida TaxID=110101 RepID=A0ABW2RJA9_9BACL
MGRRLVSDDINDDLMKDSTEDVMDYEPLEREKPKRKGLKRFFSFLFGVILIPVVMTIVLSAYKDKTNNWVYELLGMKQAQETEIDQLKHLAADGNMIHYNCGPLGSTLRGVIDNCGEPVLSQKTFNVAYTTQTLGYAKGDHYVSLLYFENEHLKRMVIIDNTFSSITLNDIKRTFGATSDKPLESEKDKVKTLAYKYALEDGKELRFTVRKDNQKLLQIELTDENRKFPLAKKNTYLNQIHRAPSHKETSGGLDAMNKLKAAVSKGDMINYDCGPLGTSLADVHKKCGTRVSAKGYNMEEGTQYLNYGYKNREIHTKFYRGVLASISVNSYSYNAGESFDSTVERPPLNITPQQVKQVFGKPTKENGTDLFGSKSNSLTYRIEDKELSFYFNDKNQCQDIWLRKADMFDEQFGYIKREFKQKQANR